VLAVDWLLAAGTVEEAERNARCDPLLLKEVLDAVVMEDMTAADLDGRRST